MVSSVLACYIAVMALLSFLNATLEWLGVRVGFEELSFEVVVEVVDKIEAFEAAVQLLGILIESVF